MMYIPKWFKPHELFPPQIAKPRYGTFDPGNWRRFDDRILKSFDQLREDFGPITGNEHGLTGCGYRFLNHGLDENGLCQHTNTYSQHYFGRAIDGHPKKESIFYIRKQIIKHPERYPFIKFLEVDVGWLHADCRNNDGKILLWSPKRGFVSTEDYLLWGDK